MQEEVVGEDTTTNMRFLSIDCGPLKQTLVGHSEAWVQKFTGLLNQVRPCQSVGQWCFTSVKRGRPAD